MARGRKEGKLQRDEGEGKVAREGERERGRWEKQEREAIEGK